MRLSPGEAHSYSNAPAYCVPTTGASDTQKESVRKDQPVRCCSLANTEGEFNFSLNYVKKFMDRRLRHSPDPPITRVYGYVRNMQGWIDETPETRVLSHVQ